MSRCYKGNSVIEVLGALAVILITISISYKICFFAEKTSIKNKEIFDKRETVNAVCNEIKYNIPFDELTNILEDGNIFIKYDKKLLDNLKEKPLMNLVSNEIDDENIIISLKDKSNERLLIKVELYNEEKVLGQEVVKGRWMDYV